MVIFSPVLAIFTKNYQKMKSQTVIKFLVVRGWKLEGEKPKFYCLKPPTKFNFEPDFKLEIPKNEKVLTYYRYMKNITEGIADVYQLNKEQLEVLFSKTLEEIKQERTLTRGMVI